MRPALAWGGYMIDEIDIRLLEQCKQNPGQPIINAIKPLLGSRKVRTLYDRMFALGVQRFIEIDRSQKNTCSVTITEKGKAVITGTENIAAQKGAKLHE
jgi:hypothetical protein